MFLHEHAHIFGYDGSRGFTDALTELLESVVRYRTTISRYEHGWNQSRDEVSVERRMSPRDKRLKTREHLQVLDRESLVQLLAELPPSLLEDLLAKHLAANPTNPSDL